MITTTWPLGTFGSVASSLAATLYHGNMIGSTTSGIYNQLRDIYGGVAGMLLHINGNLSHLFCCKVSFLTGPHCQFLGVGQGMKHI